MAEKRVELPKFERVAQFRSDSFNPDDSTIEIVWTTGASVRRFDWWDGTEYDEVLSLEPGAVRLERLNLGAPFLNTHSSYSLESMIGSIVPDSAKIKDGIGTARVQLSKADDVKDIVTKIREGVIRNTSVGYWIHKIVKTEADDGKVARWDVVDWEPLEVSAVPVPADPGSQIRSAEMARKGEGPALRSCLFVTTPKSKRAASGAKPKEKQMANAKNRAKDMTAEEALAKLREAEEAAKRVAGRRDADEDGESDEDHEAEDEDDDQTESEDERDGDEADDSRGDDKDGDERAADEDEEGDDDKKDKDEGGRAAPKGGKRGAVKAKPPSRNDIRKAAEQAARAAVEADRKRSSGIREIAARFGFPKLGERHAAKGTSVREFKDVMLERLAERQKERGTTTFGGRADSGVGEPEAKRTETKQARDFANGEAEARALLGKT